VRAEHFPRAGRLRKGYHRHQVDAFLNQVEVALSGALPPPTALEVRQAGFELVRGGYDTTAVDEALDALEVRVIVAQRLTGGRRGRVDPASEVDFLKAELAAP
jgi:DivIVA domain-containing protein